MTVADNITFGPRMRKMNLDLEARCVAGAGLLRAPLELQLPGWAAAVRCRACMHTDREELPPRNHGIEELLVPARLQATAALRPKAPLADAVLTCCPCHTAPAPAGLRSCWS